MVYIYGLFWESTKSLFYVGRTANPESRYAKHISCKPSYKRDCYMGILEKGDDLTGEDESFWINYMLFLGCELTNVHHRPKAPSPRIAW